MPSTQPILNEKLRLDWLIKNRALVSTEGSNSPDPYYFIVYRNGETGDSYPSPRLAIDVEIVKDMYKTNGTL